MSSQVSGTAAAGPPDGRTGRAEPGLSQLGVGQPQTRTHSTQGGKPDQEHVSQIGPVEHLLVHFVTVY